MNLEVVELKRGLQSVAGAGLVWRRTMDVVLVSVGEKIIDMERKAGWWDEYKTNCS